MDARLTVFVCWVAFALGGCAGHTHSLIPEHSDRDIATGTFQHEGPRGSAMMVLEYRGARFEARGFTIERNQNLVELRRSYGPGKHYDRIFSGLDTDHYSYSAQPVLRADHGAVLRCSAVWRAGGAPAGHCVTADGLRIHFRYV